jgi:hypothetical protein
MASRTDPNNNERLLVVGVMSMLAHSSAKDARLGIRIEALQLRVEARIACNSSLLKAEFFVATRATAIEIAHESHRLPADFASGAILSLTGPIALTRAMNSLVAWEVHPRFSAMLASVFFHACIVLQASA